MKLQKLNTILTNFLIGAIAIIAIESVALVTVLTAEPKRPENKKVWIEFENAQHAIDSAGKLGGKYRGLTVCVGKDNTDKDLWVPPSVRVIYESEDCKVTPANLAPRWIDLDAKTWNSVTVWVNGKKIEASRTLQEW